MNIDAVYEAMLQDLRPKPKKIVTQSHVAAIEILEYLRDANSPAFGEYVQAITGKVNELHAKSIKPGAGHPANLMHRPDPVLLQYSCMATGVLYSY